MPIAVRGAQPDDADALFAVQRASSLAAFAHIFPPDRYPFPDEPVRRSWQRTLADPAARVLVAERAGDQVGLVSFFADRGLLERLFVVPTGWGAGVGSELHDRAVAAMREAEAGVFWLSVAERNERARRFYERRGWRASGQTRQATFPPFPVMLRYELAR